MELSGPTPAPIGNPCRGGVWAEPALPLDNSESVSDRERMDFGLHEMLMAAAIGLPWVLIPGGLVGVDWWLRGR